MAVAAPLSAEDLASLEAAGLGHIGAKVRALLDRQAHDRHEIEWRDAKIEKLTFEMAQLRRVKFGKKSEQLDAEQKALFDEAVDADLAALEAQLAELMAAKRKETEPAPERPKRAALPAHLPRVERHHEPSDTTCPCGCQMKRIGEDVSEKLDYTPGSFTVERHVRGKWACAKCRTLTQAPVPAEIIDKGLPTSGLLAHVLVAKHSDHLPLYRQEAILERAGLAIPRSTLAAWVGVCGVRLQPLVDAMKADLLRLPVLHADETPVAMLAPGTGKTHRAYLWAYASGAFEQMRAVVYDFTESRSGQHPRTFLGHGTDGAWMGSLVCDDYAGYKALFLDGGITEVGCMAHARRKFVELHLANKSTLAATAIEFIGQLYGIEREAKDLVAEDRLRERRTRAAAVAQALHKWLPEVRPKVPDGSATAKAMDYSLHRWAALTRYLGDPALPIDNNFDEQQIRPWATGRKNWLFAGTLLAGQRAAAIMSLIQTAKLNGHDPYAYLKDVLQRLPTQRACDIDQLLPYRWVRDRATGPARMWRSSSVPCFAGKAFVSSKTEAAEGRPPLLEDPTYPGRTGGYVTRITSKLVHDSAIAGHHKLFLPTPTPPTSSYVHSGADVSGAPVFEVPGEFYSAVFARVHALFGAEAADSSGERTVAFGGRPFAVSISPASATANGATLNIRPIIEGASAPR